MTSSCTLGLNAAVLLLPLAPHFLPNEDKLFLPVYILDLLVVYQWLEHIRVFLMHMKCNILDKNVEKSRILEARKTAILGINFKYFAAWLRLKLNTKMGLKHSTTLHHQELLDPF